MHRTLYKAIWIAFGVLAISYWAAPPRFQYELHDVTAAALFLGVILAWYRERWWQLRNAETCRPAETITGSNYHAATAEKMKAVGLLAGGLAHELNNSVSLIAGYAEEAEHKGPSADLNRRLQEVVATIRRVTDQVLTFSGRHPSTDGATDLSPVLECTLSSANRVFPSEVELTWHLEQGVFPVSISAEQAEQLILDLLVNARDALVERGKVEVSLAMHKVTEKLPWAGGMLDAGIYCRLRISDNGRGLESDLESRIFEPFFTTKSARTHSGLGLANAFGIVQSASGAILVDSAPGRGCEFSILLPALAPSSLTHTHTEGTPRHREGPIRVALVEDESSLRKLLEKTLTRSGFQVESAGDGKDALEIFSGRARDFDILVSDIVLPGLRGSTIAARLKTEHPQLRVVLMSGYIDGANEGFQSDIFLQKPFAPKQLLHALQQLSGQVV